VSGSDQSTYLVTGVLSEDSIAFGIARALQADGARILVTGHGRSARLTANAIQALPVTPELFTFDAREEADYAGLAAALSHRCSSLDGIVHCIGHAPDSALGGHFLSTPTEDALLALRVSAVSLQGLARELLPLLVRAPQGASIVALDFDAHVAWRGYDWMGVSKSALASVARYLALYLGEQGVRVNLVSAGPLETLSGTAVSTYPDLVRHWAQAPLGWDPLDMSAVVDAVVLLLSHRARGITGEIVHVDGGMHAVGLGPMATAELTS